MAKVVTMKVPVVVETKIDSDQPSRNVTEVAELSISGSTGGTANAALQDVSTAVTGVDGTGSNAASKADVDSRLTAIANNQEEILSALERVGIVKRT